MTVSDWNARRVACFHCKFCKIDYTNSPLSQLRKHEYQQVIPIYSIHVIEWISCPFCEIVSTKISMCLQISRHFSGLMGHKPFTLDLQFEVHKGCMKNIQMEVRFYIFEAYMMSVVGKLTCSGFKTGLYISYHGGNAVRHIKQRGYFMKDGRISGYFYTKYMTILQIEQILHNFEQVNFRVTLVISRCPFLSS